MKVYVWEKTAVDFPGCAVFNAAEGQKIVFGDWKDIAPVLAANEFAHIEIENNCRNSAIPMLDMKDIPARIEPASATPVIVEDGVLVGANAVVIEGVHVGKNAVVAAGAVVIEDVPDNAVVAGSPARIIKMKDEKTEGKTALVDALRKL